MTIEKQIKIMETQLRAFDTLLQKVSYLTYFFDPDPEYSQEARDIVRGNICKEFK